MACRTFHLGVIAVVLFTLILASGHSSCQTTPAPAELEAGHAKALFCAFGGVGLMPVPTPPEFEAEFAVAIVEINSATETPHVSLTDFVLFDQAGKKIKYKRLVSVEVFERPRVATEGSFAYYLNPGGTHPWNGTLPAGKIRLRIKVVLPNSLMETRNQLVAFGLTIGTYAIAGRIDGEWPT